MEIEAAMEWEFKPIEFNEKNDGEDCQIGQKATSSILYLIS